MTAIALKPAGDRRRTGCRPAIGLGQLFTNRKVLGLLLIRVFTGPITTFYWTWLPLYLRGPQATGGRGMSFLADRLVRVGTESDSAWPATSSAAC